MLKCLNNLYYSTENNMFKNINVNRKKNQKNQKKILYIE